MGELDIRVLLRLLGEEDKRQPDPLAQRLLEMYRHWCRENGITPSR